VPPVTGEGGCGGNTVKIIPNECSVVVLQEGIMLNLR